MEIKQKGCFHGRIISHWHLEGIEPYVRQAAEFVNLYSQWRGQNRFTALLRTFDVLRRRTEVIASGVEVPALPKLREFVDCGVPLGNASLSTAAQKTGDPELASVLKWSMEINEGISRTVKSLPPFPWARESLERAHTNSDVICVSQTPGEALVREWSAQDLAKHVEVIAGQELGSKTEQIALATRGRYIPDRVLMIGDAPGDRQAALDNHALFYPVKPGQEADSWEHFYTEAYDRFLRGQYAGTYEEQLVEEFCALLPATPPWEA